jgi:hypothetical protein
MLNPGIDRLGCQNEVAMTVEAIAIPSRHPLDRCYRDPGDVFTIG